MERVRGRAGNLRRGAGAPGSERGAGRRVLRGCLALFAICVFPPVPRRVFLRPRRLRRQRGSPAAIPGAVFPQHIILQLVVVVVGIPFRAAERGVRVVPLPQLVQAVVQPLEQGALALQLVLGGVLAGLRDARGRGVVLEAEEEGAGELEVLRGRDALVERHVGA